MSTIVCVIAEFIGLKPKMYSILKDDGQEKKKAREISREMSA